MLIRKFLLIISYNIPNKKSVFKTGVIQDTEQLRNESIACLRAKAQQHQLQLSLQPTSASSSTTNTSASGNTSYPTASAVGTLHASG